MHYLFVLYSMRNAPLLRTSSSRFPRWRALRYDECNLNFMCITEWGIQRQNDRFNNINNIIIIITLIKQATRRRRRDGQVIRWGHKKNTRPLELFFPIHTHSLCLPYVSQLNISILSYFYNHYRTSIIGSIAKRFWGIIKLTTKGTVLMWLYIHIYTIIIVGREVLVFVEDKSRCRKQVASWI